MGKLENCIKFLGISKTDEGRVIAKELRQAAMQYRTLEGGKLKAKDASVKAVNDYINELLAEKDSIAEQVRNTLARRKPEGAEIRQKVQGLIDTGQLTKEELDTQIRNKPAVQKLLQKEIVRPAIGVEKGGQGTSSAEKKKFEKRVDYGRREQIQKMLDERNVEAAHKAIYEDPLTGLLNNRAWQEAEPKTEGKVIASIDVSGLGWINDNFGHASGDILLRTVADTLKANKIEAYRKGGDEIAGIFDNQQNSDILLSKAQKEFADKVIEVTAIDGKKYSIKGWRLDYGTGKDFKTADGNLYTGRLEQTSAGLRSPAKGGKPLGLVETISQGVNTQDLQRPAKADQEVTTPHIAPQEKAAALPEAQSGDSGVFVSKLDLIKRYANETGEKINTEADLAKVQNKYPAEWKKAEQTEQYKKSLWDKLPEDFRQNRGINEYTVKQLEAMGTDKTIPSLLKDLNDAIGDKGAIGGEGGADVSRVVPILMDIGKTVYADGHQTYIQFKNQMKETLGTAYDKVKNIMLKIWEMVKRYNEQLGERGSISTKKLIRETTGQVKPSDMVREDVALKAGFKKAVLAAREAYRAGNKEGYAKAKAQVMNILNRREKIRAVRDYFGLTDAEMKTISRKNPLLMSQYEFKIYIDEVRQKALELVENSWEKARIMQNILEKNLRKVNNYRMALDLPPITQMTTKQAEQFADLLEPFHEGDVFLTIRELETVDRTDLAGIRTWREAKERLARETGVSVEELEKIHVTEFDKYRWDTSLAEKNPFYKMVVTETTKKLLEGNIRYHEVENKVFELARKSEKAKSRSLIEKAIPQDKQILTYLEARVEDKEPLAKQMTTEQLNLANYIQTYFKNALEYLIKTNALEKGRENYFVHVRRSFLENAKEEGLVQAVKDLFTSYQEDLSVFQILDKDTGKILPLEKFFQFSLHRSGELKPSANIVKAFLTYARTFEKKVSLDEIIPKIDIYAQSLTPQGLTPRGLEKDRSLKTFINEFINNKKGRHIDQLVGKQGGVIDVGIRGVKTFTTLLDLGFNLPVGLASYIGESVTNFIQLGTKKAALGAIRVHTDKGKRIAKKYEAWTERSLWENFTAPGKEVTERLAEGLFGLFHASMTTANKHYLLGSLTEEEYRTETLDSKRLAELKLDMGRWRVVPGSKSLVGSTSIGSSAMQYKTWAAPIIRTAAKDINTLVKDLKNKPTGAALTTKEAKEIYRIIGLTGTVLIVMALVDADEDDKSFMGQLLKKAYRESLTLMQGVDPKLWLATPRIIGFITKLGENLHAIIRLEEYKTKEGYKGVEGLKKQLTPRAIKQFQIDNQPKGRERQ